jgi:hypothetical protein
MHRHPFNSKELRPNLVLGIGQIGPFIILMKLRPLPGGAGNPSIPTRFYYWLRELSF